MKKFLIVLSVIVLLVIHFYIMAHNYIYRDCVSYYLDLVGSFIYLLICTFFILLFFGGIVGMFLVLRYMILAKGKNWGERMFGMILLTAFCGLSYCGGLLVAKEMLMRSHNCIHDIVEDCYHYEKGKCLPQRLYEDRY